MSRRLPRVAFTSSAAALALVVLLPTAALACPDQGGSSGSSRSKSEKSDRGSQAKAQGRSDNSNDAKGRSSTGSTSGAATGGTQDGHNPPGNNGTIKIDYPAPADSGHANRPHPGCAFQLRMFDFDTNQYGTITFVGQAPTKLGTLLTQQHVLLSKDAAGGGQDVDEVYSYTAQQLGLIGKPQAKQGWHIKVSVDAENAPGGAKHKVFWLSCPAPTAPAAGTTSDNGNSNSNSTSGGSTVTQTTQGAGTAQTSVPAGTTAGSTVPATTSTTTTATGTEAAAGNGTAVTGLTGGAATAAITPAAPATRPAAAGPAGLPFTGIALGSMIALALGALAAGALAIRAGRRRTSAEL